MKRYRVVGLLTISVSTVVEAATKKKALELAMDTPLMSFCHQCASGDDTTEWVTSGELDAEPRELEATEEEE